MFSQIIVYPASAALRDPAFLALWAVLVHSPSFSTPSSSTKSGIIDLKRWIRLVTVTFWPVFRPNTNFIVDWELNIKTQSPPPPPPPVLNGALALQVTLVNAAYVHQVGTAAVFQSQLHCTKQPQSCQTMTTTILIVTVTENSITYTMGINNLDWLNPLNLLSTITFHTYSSIWICEEWVSKPVKSTKFIML